MKGHKSVYPVRCMRLMKCCGMASEEGGGNITSVCKEDECTDCRDGENDTDW